MCSKEQITGVFYHALSAVSPVSLISETLQYKHGCLYVQHRQYKLDDYRSLYIFGSGKASIEMSKAVSAILEHRFTEGLIISNYCDIPPNRIHVFESSHPVPTEKSIQAADMLIANLSKLTEDDFYIYLLSGGNSSLVEKPLPPMTLYDFQKATGLLLENGVPIEDFNTVRKHLSMVKGGRLGQSVRARGIVLIISDVIDDDLETIGSAPLYCDTSSYGDAYAVLLK